ncbi:hypothetical protein [Tardiphaga sp.]|nr:hypothetical protein [Tardiphaga sp.]MDB5618213.1 hypothetical protein [Tardiphaga sp.]
MSLYQFAAVVDGWNAAHDTEGGTSSAPTAAEFDEAKRMHGDG